MATVVSATEASLEDSIIIALTGLVELEIGCGEAGRCFDTDLLSLFFP